jgi:predicted nucleic acid-binding protein
MIAMRNKIFADSNVWIYLFTSDDISKNELAREFISENTAEGNILVVSYQVINEVGVVLKRKKKFDETKIRFVFETMFDLCVVQDFSQEIILKASELRNTISVSYWDSIIIATALEARYQYLTSEDMQAGQKISTLIIRNIFAD